MNTDKTTGKIIHATDSDLSEIMELIKKVILSMNESGIFQWNDAYPNIGVVSKDIKKHELYILKIGESIGGIATLNEEKSIEFGQSHVFEPTRKELILHRLAIHPGYQRSGLASQLLDYSENYAIAKDYKSIQLSVLSGNYIARKFYEKNNFREIGSTYFSEWDLRMVYYEKVISSRPQ
jgi:ribosomal protein S18 acetylase RimI-like enzyme